MPRAPGIRDFDVTRAGVDGVVRVESDAVAVEQPLEFRVDGQPGAVTMRTPGDDEDLLRGLLYAEGMITRLSDIRGFDPLRDNVIDVRLRSALARRRLPERSMIASSSCGVCGKVSLESLQVCAPVVRSSLQVGRSVVALLPERLRAGQATFEQTGGLHAAGVFTVAGDLLAVREDVGRHNAVDKLVGWALLEGRLPAHESVLCISGRLSFEIVQKAAVAGFPVIAAVSAPSSMAIDVADQFGLTLCGFVRGGSFNIYTRPDRVC